MSQLAHVEAGSPARVSPQSPFFRPGTGIKGTSSIRVGARVECLFEKEGWQGGAIISELDPRNLQKKRKSSKKGSSTNRPVLFDDDFVHRIDFSLQDSGKTWRYEQSKELQLNMLNPALAGAEMASESECAPQVSEPEMAPVDAASLVPGKSHAGQKPAVEQLDNSGITGDTQKSSDLDDASVGAVEAAAKNLTNAITAAVGGTQTDEKTDEALKDIADATLKEIQDEPAQTSQQNLAARVDLTVETAPGEVRPARAAASASMLPPNTFASIFSAVSKKAQSKHKRKSADSVAPNTAAGAQSGDEASGTITPESQPQASKKSKPSSNPGSTGPAAAAAPPETVTKELLCQPTAGAVKPRVYRAKPNATSWLFNTKAGGTFGLSECNRFYICGHKECHPLSDGELKADIQRKLANQKVPGLFSVTTSNGTLRLHMQNAHNETEETVSRSAKELAVEVARAKKYFSDRKDQLPMNQTSKRLHTAMLAAYIVIQDLQPASTIERTGFRNLEAARTGLTYEPMCADTLMKYADEICALVNTLMYKELQNAITGDGFRGKGSGGTDGWTSHGGDAFLATNYQWLDENLEKHIILWNFVCMEEKHSGGNIIAAMNADIKQAGLMSVDNTPINTVDDLFFAITSDNASNMVAGCRDFTTLVARIPCLAHLLQLTPKAVLANPKSKVFVKTAADIISKCAAVVTHFSHSGTDTKKLVDFCSNSLIEEKIRGLIQRGATRWDSYHDMLKSIAEHEKSLAVFVDQNADKIHALTKEEMTVVKQLVGATFCFRYASKIVQGREYETMSMYLPLLRMVQSQLVEMKNLEYTLEDRSVAGKQTTIVPAVSVDPIVKKVREKLSAHLTKQIGKLLDPKKARHAQEILVASAYLNPYMKATVQERRPVDGHDAVNEVEQATKYITHLYETELGGDERVFHATLAQQVVVSDEVDDSAHSSEGGEMFENFMTDCVDFDMESQAGGTSIVESSIDGSAPGFFPSLAAELVAYKAEAQQKGGFTAVASGKHLEWWRERKKRYERLFNVVRLLFAAFASEALIESLFSYAAVLLPKNRASMTPARVARIIVAHQNFHLLEAAAAKEFPERTPTFPEGTPKAKQVACYLLAHLPCLQPKAAVTIKMVFE